MESFGQILRYMVAGVGALCLVGVFFMIKEKLTTNKYVNCVRKLLHQDEDAYQTICSTLTDIKEEYLANRLRLLKLFAEIGNDDQAAKQTLSDLDIVKVFYGKKNFDKDKLKNSSDAFLWVILSISKAYSFNNMEMVEAIYDKVKVGDELFDKSLEYNLTVNFYYCLTNKEDRGLGFYNDLLEGEYSGYTYDKSLISVVKNMAMTIKAFMNEELHEDEVEDVRYFAGTIIGKMFISHLGLTEKYPPIKEDEDEDDEETEEAQQ